MYLTLGQAAKESGKSKATISKYIKSGKLSFVEKTKDGFQIDPSELFRVFPKGKQLTGQSERSQTPVNTKVNSAENEEIKALKDTIAELRSDKEDYKNRLDNAEQRISKLTDTISQQTLLLTDMRQKPPEKPVQLQKGLFSIFSRRKA